MLRIFVINRIFQSNFVKPPPVRGITEGDMSIFKSIPFAAPPVGKFRWRPPQPVKNWEGELDATKPCKDCGQSGWGPNAPKMNPNSSEDCLFLNVWKYS